MNILNYTLYIRNVRTINFRSKFEPPIICYSGLGLVWHFKKHLLSIKINKITVLYTFKMSSKFLLGADSTKRQF